MILANGNFTNAEICEYFFQFKTTATITAHAQCLSFSIGAFELTEVLLKMDGKVSVCTF